MICRSRIPDQTEGLTLKMSKFTSLAACTLRAGWNQPPPLT